MKMIAGVLMAIIAATFSSEAMAQSNCQNVVAALTPCFDFVSGGASSPSSQCCNQLENVVQTDPICLCQVQNQGGVNKTRVLGLPGECNVRTPPVSDCNSPSGSSSSQTPPGSSSSQTLPSPSSGYWVRGSCSLMLSVLIAASLDRVYAV